MKVCSKLNCTPNKKLLQLWIKKDRSMSWITLSPLRVQIAFTAIINYPPFFWWLPAGNWRTREWKLTGPWMPINHPQTKLIKRETFIEEIARALFWIIWASAVLRKALQLQLFYSSLRFPFSSRGQPALSSLSAADNSEGSALDLIYLFSRAHSLLLMTRTNEIRIVEREKETLSDWLTELEEREPEEDGLRGAFFQLR